MLGNGEEVLPIGRQKIPTTQAIRELKAHGVVISLPEIYINAGRRWLLARMAPGKLSRVLEAVSVNAAV
ncbi:MAG: hypothetical protein DRH20_12530 [Deltaproteobacteria bacterium]|nr:MAG: hypothetical protein DRH20_12530 [Deltaproteobacteria bacterium]